MKNIKKVAESERGVTLVALVAMMIVIFTILSIAVYNGTTSVKLEKLNKIYSDIETLEEKLTLYYIKNEELPISESSVDVSFDNNSYVNQNDGENKYYSIDSSILGDVNLNNDISNYCVNTDTMTVYYIPGYTYKDIKYYTVPQEVASIYIGNSEYYASNSYSISVNLGYEGSTEYENYTYEGKCLIEDIVGDFSRSYIDNSTGKDISYYFNGWVDKEGTTTYYAYKGDPESVSGMWITQKSVTVNFYRSTNTDTIYTSRSYNVGYSYNTSPNTGFPDNPYLYGNVFVEWNTKPDGTGETITEDMIATAGITELYAIYKENDTTYTVTFDALDGTVSTSQKTIQYGSKYGTLPTAVPNDSKYQFDGWYTSTSFETKVTSDTIVRSTGNITLYAKYILKSVTLTYDFNLPDGASNDGTYDNQTKEYTAGDTIGNLLTLNDTTIEVNGTTYTFVEWQDSDGNSVTADTVITDDTTIYAKWSAESE